MFLRTLVRGAAMMAATSLPFFCAEKRKNEVYIWGNGVYQARPDALLQFKNFCPKRITNLPDNLMKLEFGQYYEAGIDENGGLWVWKSQSLDSNVDNENSQFDHQRKEVQQISKDIKQVKFTTGYIWTLNKKGQVHQYPIIKEFSGKQVKGVKLGKVREVQPLKGSAQIATGYDHLLALKNGQVWTMGDDTYGQCGIQVGRRATFPPFSEQRISYPAKVPSLKNIKKIAAGGYHSLALDESGSLYGWGSNSNLQLSHEEQFSQMNSPLIAAFTPVKISKALDSSEIVDMKAGEQFTVLVAKNRLNESYEVFTFGTNLRGQLGQGEIRHVRDVTKVEALSNFVLKRKGKEQRVMVTSIGCGKTHTIVQLNIGYVMQWGDNEHGQMGNKKRSSVYTPIIVRQFSQKDIIGVFAGWNSSGVIVKEDLLEKVISASSPSKEKAQKK